MTEAKELKPIEPKGTDMGQFEGRRVKIESEEIIQVRNKFSKNGEAMTDVLKVVSESLGVIEDKDGNPIKDKDGNPIELHASELFNLTKDNEGKLGWSTKSNAKLTKFMKKLGVSRPEDLVGKLAVTRIRTKKTEDGDKEFLGFITD